MFMTGVLCTVYGAQVYLNMDWKLICTDKLLIHDLSYLILCVYNYDIYRVLRNLS